MGVQLLGGRKKAIASVMPMVYQKAHDTNMLLAPHTRNWVQFQDLAQDGVVHILDKVLPTFNPNKRQFASHTFQLLDHHFLNMIAVNGVVRAEERDARKTLSYDTDLINGRQISLVVPSTFKIKTPSPEESAINKIDAERAFLQVYSCASPLLRKYLIRWLLQPKITKFKSGTAFRQARKEFRTHAASFHLTKDLCEFIISQNAFRKELCFKIVCVLRIRTKRRVFQPESLLNSEERYLVPIFCTPQEKKKRNKK